MEAANASQKVFTECAAQVLHPKSREQWCLPHAGPPKDGKEGL